MLALFLIWMVNCTSWLRVNKGDWGGVSAPPPFLFMNMLEMVQFVADQTDVPPPNTVFDANPLNLGRRTRRLKNHVNRAYTMIKLALGRLNEDGETLASFATAANVETYGFPAGILTIQQLKIDPDPPIRILPWPEYERYKADTFLITVTGYPDVASIYGRRIYLYPTPDTTYTVDVRGLASLAEMVQDTDEPSLPPEMHQSVAELALHLELAYSGDPNAGVLAVSENGDLQAQGGQAAIAVAMFRSAKRNMRQHHEEPPRIIPGSEMGRMDRLRRIIKA